MTDDSFSAVDRDALAAAARAIAASGMVVGSAGNLSLRRGKRMLITPMGAQLAALEPGDLVEVALADGAAAGGGRPSSETPLHRTAYAATDAGAVVHTHSHFATVIGTLVDELPAIHYAMAAFGGPVRVAPYATFGTGELAAAVTQALDGRRAVLMANHGAVVAGRDIGHALALAEELEWLASVHWHALAAGRPRVLSPRDLDEVRQQMDALAYGAAIEHHSHRHGGA